MIRELNDNEEKVMIYLEIRTKVEIVRLEDVLNGIRDITFNELVKAIQVLKAFGLITINEQIIINK